MKIPNVTIIIKAANNASAVKQQPAWFADMYRAVWGSRLDRDAAGGGVAVEPLPDITPTSSRYSEFGSVAEAELTTVRFFSQGDARREEEIVKLFRDRFPDGLNATVTKLLEADARDYAARKATQIAKAKPHPSYLSLGMPADMAINFQGAGYATAQAVPCDLLRVSEIAGVTPGEAVDLLAKFAALHDADADLVATATAKGLEDAALAAAQKQIEADIAAEAAAATAASARKTVPAVEAEPVLVGANDEEPTVVIRSNPFAQSRAKV